MRPPEPGRPPSRAQVHPKSASDLFWTTTARPRDQVPGPGPSCDRGPTPSHEQGFGRLEGLGSTSPGSRPPPDLSSSKPRVVPFTFATLRRARTSPTPSRRWLPRPETGLLGSLRLRPRIHPGSLGVLASSVLAVRSSTPAPLAAWARSRRMAVAKSRHRGCRQLAPGPGSTPGAPGGRPTAGPSRTTTRPGGGAPGPGRTPPRSRALGSDGGVARRARPRAARRPGRSALPGAGTPATCGPRRGTPSRSGHGVDRGVQVGATTAVGLRPPGPWFGSCMATP